MSKTAFTIATANYLAQAKTVATSFLRYNSDYEFKIVLLDRILEGIDTKDFNPAEIIEIESFDISGFGEMLERYTIFELSNALKPFIAGILLSNSKSEKDVVVYLDSDILFFNSLGPIEFLLEDNSILLSPHSFLSMPNDGLTCNDQSLLMHGIYNGGFFALRCDVHAEKFIDWWKLKLEKESFVDHSKGLFVDQKWLNLVPLFFKGVAIITHLGINVGYWNLHERQIENSEGIYRVNKIFDLIFFHFSGYEISNPMSISKHQNRYNFTNTSFLDDILTLYKQALESNGYLQYSSLKCYYVNDKIEVKPEQSFLKKVFKKLSQLH